MGNKPGPVPARSTQRRRRNKTEPVTTVPVTAAATVPDAAPQLAPPTAMPEADPGWHELAREWYVSLGQSGQKVFFEPSDWAAARIVATELSRMLRNGRQSAQMFAGIWTAMGDLLTTEAERRRLRIELERDGTSDPDDEAAVLVMETYQQRMQA